MQQTQNDQTQTYLALLNTYPSPHNGQPMVLRALDDHTWDVFFDTSRGLRSTPISYLFSFVTVGVFFAHAEACGRALGHAVETTVVVPPDDEGMRQPGLLHCGQLRLQYGTVEADSELETAIRFRQTSRRKYHAGLTGNEKAAASTLATPHGLTATFLEEAQAHQAVWLNQRAVFDDMFNIEVREELLHWLRFNQREKSEKRDGLAYDCMELRGGMLKFVCDHYRFLRWPVVAPLLKEYYLRTMQDKSSVGYVRSAFSTPQDAYTIGRYITELWLLLSRERAYMHPFGTIVSNEQAHADFVRLAGIETEERGAAYVVFVFRAGRSDVPVRSERLMPATHLSKEAVHV